jgi:hypothetical protein
VSAYVFSTLYDVPLWLTWPKLIPLSGILIQRPMNVTVNPKTPQNLGDIIVVKVLDDLNKTVIEGVKIEISKNGDLLIVLLTDNFGSVIFEYPGETTIIKATKEGYGPVLKVIPKIPDKWNRTYNQYRITTLTALLSLLITTASIVLKYSEQFSFIKHPLNKKKFILESIAFTIYIIGVIYFFKYLTARVYLARR